MTHRHMHAGTRARSGSRCSAVGRGAPGGVLRPDESSLLRAIRQMAFVSTVTRELGGYGSSRLWTDMSTEWISHSRSRLSSLVSHSAR